MPGTGRGLPGPMVTSYDVRPMTHGPPRLSRRAFVSGLLAAPALGACFGGGEEDATVSPTTTSAAPPTAPLTGLPFGGDPAIMARPALVIKVDNLDVPGETARPQAGINQADVVFEERTEGGITRLAAVYHSTDADPVVPVRSGRLTDVDVCTMLNRPLFANSGASDQVLAKLRRSNLVEIGHATVGNEYYHRAPDRRPPHNLGTSTPVLYRLTPPDAQPPPSLFTYRAPDAPPTGGRPVVGVHVEFGGGPAQAPVDHRYDAATQGWARFQNGTPHVDAADVQVAPENVIVQFVDYNDTTAVLIGQGGAWVCTGGQLVEGRWSRPDPGVPTTFVDGADAPIALLPGVTWVLLAPPGGATVL